MKTSFIATVFNEEKTINIFLNSLLVQSKKPDEIVIVDAYSSDDTFLVLKSFVKKFPKGVFRIVKHKGNRSVGRNIAIKKSSGEVIAVSDGGCILEKHWFERVTKPFGKNEIQVVAGFYKPITNNVFQKCLAAYTCVPFDKVDQDFLPSSRSIAFRKSAWQKVGGYPEELNTCEDLVFAKKLKVLGLKFSVEKKAIVKWPQRENLMEASKQFFSYALGDGRAGYIRFQTPFLYIRYMLGLMLVFFALEKNQNLIFIFILIATVFYLAWSIFKNYKYVGKKSAIFILPILQVTSDASVLLGTTIGLLQNITKNEN